MSLEDRLQRLELPPGQIVRGEDGATALWLSDGPAEVGLWRAIAGEQAGLWPLVLGHDGPWDSGELVVAEPGDGDPAVLLPKWWYEYVGDGDEDAFTVPFGRDWPGFAPALPLRDDPAGAAFTLVESLLGRDPLMRLGLVAADRSADVLASAGWTGPVNYIGEAAEVVAVVRDWEERFGARVVGLGYDTLYLSVAAPPQSKDDALLVAAEHFAFCPDNVWQDLDRPTVDAYAERLVGRGRWVFWWD